MNEAEKSGIVKIDRDALPILQRYSKGDISAQDAMDLLRISCKEDLFAATLDAGLTLPRPTNEQAEQEANQALAFLGKRMKICQ